MRGAPLRPARGMRRATAVLGLVGVVGLLILASAEAASGLPRSTADASDVRITVTALTPTSLEPDGTLVITGRVVNASDATLQEVGARLRVGITPLVARGELASFASGSGPPEVGSVPVASLVDVAAELTPGAAADVRIEVPAAELGLAGGFGVHPLTLEIRVADPSGLRRTAGTARTFIVTSGTGAAPDGARLVGVAARRNSRPRGRRHPLAGGRHRPRSRARSGRSARRAARRRRRPAGDVVRRRRAAGGRPERGDGERPARGPPAGPRQPPPG